MNGKYLWLSVLLTVVAFGVSLVLFPRLPENVPTHWNIQGHVDGYSPRALGALLMPGFMLAIVLGSWLLKWLSPKSFEVERFADTYSYVLFCAVALMGYMHALMLWAALGDVAVDRAMVGGFFLFFGLLGNVMGRIRRNFWMGVRTPWTLASDEVWDKTHRMAARVYAVTGLVGVILVAFGLSMPVLFVLMIVAATLPIPYSLYLAKKDDISRNAGILILAGLIFLCAVAGICAAVYAVVPHRGAPAPELSAKAVYLLDNMSAGRAESAERDFAPVMRSALPPGKLSDVWRELEATLGTYRSRSDISGEDKGSFKIVYIRMKFEKGDRDLKVVFDRTGEVSGLWVTN